MLREVVVDTETTGLDHASGDRVIEIGCVEIVNRIPTGREFHRYFNPERDVHEEALAVHGLSREFLTDKPLFQDVADEWLAFLGDAPIVMHNASFDVGFLNAELQRVPKPLLGHERVVDTLLLARRRHPAGPNSLDALCKRYGIDNSKRSKHGALQDSFLLAQVYVELLGERQATLGLGDDAGGEVVLTPRAAAAKPRPEPLARRLSQDAEKAHAEFVKTLGVNALWLRYADSNRTAN
jgi:DNA polymerase-3 subunit epsilon